VTTESSLQSSLDDWAEHLDRIIPAGSGAVWVRLWAPPGSDRLTPPWPESARPELSCPEPGDVEILSDLCGLMGWVAPPCCLAIAVVADGNVLPTAPGPAGAGTAGAGTAGAGTAGAGTAGAGTVRVVCVLHRSGRVSTRIHLDGRPTSLEPPSGGRLLDSMRRAFALPTAAPTTPSTALVGRIWLGVVADACRDGMVALGWEQVRRLHPAVALMASHGMAVTDETVDAALRLAPQVWSWEWLRQQTAEGRWAADLVAPALADWMDEGMFSRWVLDETRGIDELLAEVGPGLSHTARQRLADRLR
jgi:hypothetical protein